MAPVDVSGIDRRRYGKLAHMADGAALGVDYRGPHEGRDARPVIGMLCHRSAAVLYALYLLLRMLAQLAGDRCRRGRSYQYHRQHRGQYHGKGTGIGKDRRGNLDIQEIHKHTAINTVI
jgi:hypothetical protein